MKINLYHKNTQYFFTKHRYCSCYVLGTCQHPLQMWTHLIPVTSLGGGPLIFFNVQRGDWGTERLSDWPEVPWLLSLWSWAATQAAWLWDTDTLSTVSVVGKHSFPCPSRLGMGPPKSREAGSLVHRKDSSLMTTAWKPHAWPLFWYQYGRLGVAVSL